jgi:hypothetical protein
VPQKLLSRPRPIRTPPLKGRGSADGVGLGGPSWSASAETALWQGIARMVRANCGSDNA